MKVSAIVGVKDEVELIERCIEHLYAIGVDDIVIQDYGSTDGTEKILEQYNLKVVPFDENRDMSGESWGLREAGLACATCADWVIFLDADEFWLPINGSIKEVLAKTTADVLSVRRFNSPLRSDGRCIPDNLSVSNYDKVLLYVEKIENIRKELQSFSPRPWISSPPLPKIAVRPSSIRAVTVGHHHVIDRAGMKPPLSIADDIVIAHVPFTTLDRFQQKVTSIRESIRLQPSYHTGGTAWHWKRWIELDDGGELGSEFQHQVIEDSQLQSLLDTSAVKSAHQVLNETVTNVYPVNNTDVSVPVKVSVHMPAYNHERYIGEALDSVLRQKTNFTYEIVIGEDMSLDQTRAIARKYATAHPDKIRLIENKKNLGIWDNDQVIIAACRGEYIAWLESDDFWKSPDKLQRQVDFLDKHPDFSASFHKAACLTDSEFPITWKGGPEKAKPIYTVDDLLEQGHFIPSCTAVFRTELVREPLNWTRGTPFLETAYAIRFALQGKIGFIDEEMATFRFHSNGVYGSATKIKNIQNAIDAHLLVGQGFDLTSKQSYSLGLKRLYDKLSKQYFAEGLAVEGIKAELKGLQHGIMAG